MTIHDDPTLARAQLSFGRPADPVTLAVDATSSSKSGWVVSGLAAVLAIAALSVVGGIAFETLGTSAPAATTLSVPAPRATQSAVSVAEPAPAPAPVFSPPSDVSPASASPVENPPQPAPPPWPHPRSGAITICDLIKCDPIPPSSSNPTPPCSDSAACTPRPAP